jgi:hypothetical protein
MGTMADNRAQLLSHPAMDYAEHEKPTGRFSSSKNTPWPRGPHSRLAGFVLRVTVAEPASAFDQPRLDQSGRIGLGQNFKHFRSHSC